MRPPPLSQGYNEGYDQGVKLSVDGYLSKIWSIVNRKHAGSLVGSNGSTDTALPLSPLLARIEVDNMLSASEESNKNFQLDLNKMKILTYWLQLE